MQPHMASIIRLHNQKVLNPQQKCKERKCNCKEIASQRALLTMPTWSLVPTTTAKITSDLRRTHSKTTSSSAETLSATKTKLTVTNFHNTSGTCEKEGSPIKQLNGQFSKRPLLTKTDPKDARFVWLKSITSYYKNINHLIGAPNCYRIVDTSTNIYYATSNLLKKHRPIINTPWSRRRNCM